MIQVDIPGNRTLKLEHLVLDFNGTLAVDGQLINGVKPLLQQLSQRLKIHIITADTFGTVKESLNDVECKVVILSPDKQDKQKASYIKRLGRELCVAIGNGLNDRIMVKSAQLGIATIQAEGAAAPTVKCADIAVLSILDGLNLLLNPQRLTATLRR